ncbi:MAG: type II secretion system F family protein [Burkholderiales bacterium]
MGLKELSNAELSSLSRQLALVVDSELSLQEGIELIIEQTKSKELKQLLLRVEERLNEGHSLGRALAEEKAILPDYYIQMVDVGEQSGNLDKVLVRLADSYDKAAEIKNKVVSAVTYPIILTVLMLCVIVLLLAEVLPIFDDVLSSLGGEMPGITRALMAVGGFISTYFYILIAVIALIVLAVIFMRQTKRGAEILDSIKLKMPIQKGIVKNLACVRFSRSLSMLLRSGISVAESLRMTSATIMNKKIQSLIIDAAERIQKGETLKNALASLGFFPEMLLRIIAVAESTGHTDNMLERAADIMEEELDTRLSKLTTVLEPALILILSIIIGIVLISVILPVTGIMNTIG